MIAFRGSIVTFAALVPFGCGSHPPEWQAALHYAAPEVFEINIGRYGYPYVQGSINGHRVELVLDTANMSGLLLAPDFAARLGLETAGYGQQFDSTGEPTGTSRKYRVERLSAFGHEWHDQVAYGDSRNDVDGYIGPAYLLGARFTLDYRTGHLAVSKSALSWPRDAGAVLPLVWSERYPGMLVVRGFLGDRPVLVQVDTGKSRTCVDPALRQSLGLRATTNGVRIPELTLAGLTFTVPSAKEVGFGAISAGLPEPIGVGVGSDILSGLVLSVDYRTRQLYLRSADERGGDR